MDEKKMESNRNFPINLGSRTPGNRLSPVLDVLIKEQVSIAQLAERLGMARSSLNRWFMLDDAKLSGVDEIAKALGYHVEWKLVKNKNK